jgi:hypothetical protein
VESRVASFLERGLGAEGEVLASVSAALPDDVRSALPQELRDALAPRAPAAAAAAAGPADPWSPNGSAYAASGNGEAKPLATWTITSMDEEDGGFPATAAPASGPRALEREVDAEPPASAATVAASQAAAELVDIQAAVVAVRGRLAELQGNGDAAAAGIVRLNLREAAAGLAMRLRQRAPGGGEGGVAQAVAEAEALLVEVEALAR